MVWGDFQEGGNVTLGGSLLGYQKRIARMVAGVGGRCHADPLLAEFGMLKVGDLNQQQLRVHAWRFWNGRLPVNQAAMLGRTDRVHGHATRSAGTGLFLSTRDHRAVGYRVPKEWATLTEAQRLVGSLALFKRGCKVGFLGAYRAFECRDRGCGACGGAHTRPNSVDGGGGGTQGGWGVLLYFVLFRLVWDQVCYPPRDLASLFLSLARGGVPHYHLLLGAVFTYPSAVTLSFTYLYKVVFLSLYTAVLP